MSLANVIDQTKKLLTQISQLRSDALHAAEMYDLRQIETSLSGVCEALENVHEYTTANTTDYTELWNQRQQEHNKLRDAQKSWIQTEIIKMYLSSVNEVNETNRANEV